MSKLSSTVKWDMRLQYKYGFYYVYAIVTFLYIILLRQLPEGLLGIATTFVIFTDPGFLGFLFIGAIILFEKSEQTLNALTVTPLKVNEYIFSKTLSLTILALLTSLIIVLFSYGLDFNYLALILGVLLTSFFFTLIGFIAVAKFNTLNEYFLTSVFYMIILTLPLIDFFKLLESPLFYLVPTQASLVLLQSAFEEVASWEIIYAVLYLVLWIIYIYRWAHRSFYRYIIMKQKGRALGHKIMATNLANLYLNDFRNIRRDPILIYGLLGPLIAMLVTRLFVPQVEQLPSEYYSYIAIFTILISPIVFGFIAGFILLDEKDDNVLMALKVLPISTVAFVTHRMIFSVTFSFIYTIIAVLILSNLVFIPISSIFPIAILIAIEAPIIALILFTFSENKVEGVALLKGLNFVFILIPVAALFIPSRLQYLAGVIPMFWPAKAFVEVVSGSADIWSYVLLGVVVHLFYLGGLLRRFGSKRF